MTTLEHGYTETTASGGTKVVHGKTIADLDNPHVGQELLDFLDDVGGTVNSFYVAAYIIENYGDDIRDDLEDASEDDLRDDVVAVERRQAEPTKQSHENRIKEIFGDASAAEREIMLQGAEEALEDVDIDDAEAQEDIINKVSGE